MPVNKETFRKYIDTIKKGLDKYPEGRLDMEETKVYVGKEESEYISYHPCGTVHCVAGWFMVGAKTDEELKSVGYNFKDGVETIDELFGCSFNYWARDNKDIWGNEDGEYMFSSPSAYGDNVSTLDHVINHLEIVYLRLEK